MFLKISNKFVNLYKLNRCFSVFVDTDLSKWRKVEDDFDVALGFLHSGNLNQALSHFDSILLESSRITPKNLEFECMWASNVAFELFSTFNDNQIQPYLQRALGLINLDHSSTLINRKETYLKLGRVCAGLNMLDEAESLLDKCLSLCGDTSDQTKIEAILTLVPIKLNRNQINEAKDLSEEGIKACEKIDNSEVFLSGILYNYAGCFYKNNELDQAIDNYKKAAEALEFHLSLSGKKVPLDNYGFIIQIMIQNKQPVEAVEYAMSILNNKKSDDAEKYTLCSLIFEMFVWNEDILPLIKFMESLADSNPKEFYYLYKLVTEYYINIKDFTSAQIYADKLYENAMTINNPTIHLVTYSLLSTICFNENPEKSKEYLDLALETISKNPEAQGKKSIYALLINYYINKYDFKNIEKYSRLCLAEIPQDSVHIDERLQIYNDLSATLFHQGNKKESTEWQEKGLEECKKYIMGRDNRIYELYGKIIIGYCEMKQFNKCFEILDEYMQYINKYFSDDKSKYATVYSVYMNVYMAMEDFDSALKYSKLTESYLEDLGPDHEFSKAIFYFQLGELHIKKSDNEQGVKNFKHSMEIFKALGETEFVDNIENKIKAYI